MTLDVYHKSKVVNKRVTGGRKFPPGLSLKKGMKQMVFLKQVILATRLLLPLGVFLGGCADGALTGAAKMERAKIWLEKVKFKVSKETNGNAPVYVDVVIAYDADVLGKISAMTADQYFDGKDQLQKDSVDKIDIFDWQVVPGEPKDDEEISLSKAYGLGGFVFARYSTPDAHREALAEEHVIMIHLDKKDFHITKVE